jgi:enoyl-CoA hydratase/carnithine racemase
MPSNDLLHTTEGPTAVLTLNRPERRNALSLELMTELIARLDAIDRSEEIRAVIIASTGTVFSSGHDLSEMRGREQADYTRLFGVCSELMLRIQSIRQPVIAEVQGMATAAGCQLVASCDLAVAAEEAAFATPGVRIGLFCTTPMVALSRAIGRKRALEMLLTGKSITAATAAEWGLINRAVPSSELKAETRRLAGCIAAASPLTVATGKRAWYAQIDLGQDEAYGYAKHVMSLNAVTADAQEGIAAFLQKRQASWSGK